MRRLLAPILFFPFLLGIPAHAQRPPEIEGYLGERHYNRRLLWAEVGAYTAANLADGITTVRNSHDHFIEQPFPRGSQELLGRYPTTLHYTLVMGAMEISSVLLAHRLERSDSRFLRILGHSLILSGTVAHADGTIHNVVTPGVR